MNEPEHITRLRKQVDKVAATATASSSPEAKDMAIEGLRSALHMELNEVAKCLASLDNIAQKLGIPS